MGTQQNRKTTTNNEHSCSSCDNASLIETWERPALERVNAGAFASYSTEDERKRSHAAANRIVMRQLQALPCGKTILYPLVRGINCLGEATRGSAVLCCAPTFTLIWIFVMVVQLCLTVPQQEIPTAIGLMLVLCGTLFLGIRKLCCSAQAQRFWHRVMNRPYRGLATHPPDVEVGVVVSPPSQEESALSSTKSTRPRTTANMKE